MPLTHPHLGRPKIDDVMLNGNENAISIAANNGDEYSFPFLLREFLSSYGWNSIWSRCFIITTNDIFGVIHYYSLFKVKCIYHHKLCSIIVNAVQTPILSTGENNTLPQGIINVEPERVYFLLAGIIELSIVARDFSIPARFQPNP